MSEPAIDPQGGNNQAKARLLKFVAEQVEARKGKHDASGNPSPIFRAMGGTGLPDSLGTDANAGAEISCNFTGVKS